MCGSMAYIQSLTAEIRREKKKKKKKKKPQDENIMSSSATQGGHKKVALCILYRRENALSVGLITTDPMLK